MSSYTDKLHLEDLTVEGRKAAGENEAAPRLLNAAESPVQHYVVKVDNNFHYTEESERYTLGDFGSAEEALAAAKGLVDEFLVREYKTGMTADELFSQYRSFGDDPFIVPDDRDIKFSAWTYAKERCEALCQIGSTELDGTTAVPPSDQSEIDGEYGRDRTYERSSLFPFLPRERYIVEELEKLVRKLLKNATPPEIRDLSKLLFAIARLPLTTKGVHISLGIAVKSRDSCHGCDIELSDQALRLGTSGFVSDGPYGSDSYSDTLLEIEPSGFRDADRDPFEVGGWFLGVYEMLQEGGEIEVVDYGDDGIDWDDTVDDIDEVWDDIRTRAEEE